MKFRDTLLAKESQGIEVGGNTCEDGDEGPGYSSSIF
jgi:hypothetical protein